MAKVKTIYDRIGEAQSNFSSDIRQADVEKSLGAIRVDAVKQKYDTFQNVLNFAGKLGEINQELGEARKTKSEVEQGIDIARKQLATESIVEGEEGKMIVPDVAFDRKNQTYTIGGDEYSKGDFQALFQKEKDLRLNKILGIKDTRYTKTEEEEKKEKTYKEYKPFEFKSLWDTMDWNN